eukprot:CAMPEP_0197328052 /NCGR_PEP_ID=MMETSP0892-20130614/3894_1 /TAXON_ID=44058 ORGANISM="Aureoumbra lagunensis, Strain CCMP1510" /NCGR_SAMPLE_ID=MMETSP0892 /ASSEMBLY_ACC=CAM_ASM_000538 /LENGTH=339 /DNA_ID=CAMNT_0042823501 /DNA_START=17 /DNA_END=1033 /DNA_ORIENTATION=-
MVEDVNVAMEDVLPCIWTLGQPRLTTEMPNVSIPTSVEAILAQGPPKYRLNTDEEVNPLPTNMMNDMDIDEYDRVAEAYCKTKVHNARHALFELRRELAGAIIKGINGVDKTLHKRIPILVDSASEFKMVFSGTNNKIIESKITKPAPVSTYSGDRDVQRTQYLVAFKTLRQVVSFFGDQRIFAAKHNVEQNKNVLICPAAVLLKTFHRQTPEFDLLVRHNKKPLCVSTSIPGGENLQSEAGRAAAATGRKVIIFLIDEERIEDTIFYHGFVSNGYVEGEEPQSYAVFDGFVLYGHTGLIPANVLNWTKKDGARHVSAVFSETLLAESKLPIRGIKTEW